MYADHPVTGVTWRQATDYAAWVGGRLPTEAEWEKACRGTAGSIYPWGDVLPTENLANFFPNTGGTMPVGSDSPQGDSPYGVADMAGNVWEWTSSRPEPYPYAAGDGREDPGAEGKRVLRGGAWYLRADYVRCASRFSFGENYGYYDFGFRVVMDAARELVASSDDAELFLYPGDQHYFADSSLPSYDATATALLTQRVLVFLATR